MGRSQILERVAVSIFGPLLCVDERAPRAPIDDARTYLYVAFVARELERVVSRVLAERRNAIVPDDVGRVGEERRRVAGSVRVQLCVQLARKSCKVAIFHVALASGIFPAELVNGLGRRGREGSSRRAP